MCINIENLLKESNKSLYWLSKETNIPYPTLHKITKNKTESIKFDFIKLICEALNCTPNDIFKF
ncbi:MULTISPECIES: helix-turn-helix transcriptional regulator [unclassified Clostridium]|uniref:helix-turn-helix domain-containing protein n=1 Tax=unclassified Clostridium TaxID=2614128 RepID=UPI00207A6C89|nr:MULTISPECIES: helix-turn-helix transcriptional regulator [unclassified Clostridium]